MHSETWIASESIQLKHCQENSKQNKMKTSREKEKIAEWQTVPIINVLTVLHPCSTGKASPCLANGKYLHKNGMESSILGQVLQDKYLPTLYNEKFLSKLGF